VTSWIGPARYLAVANGVGAACALAAGIYQARVLGPEQLGVMGIIAGITGSALTFVDVRLNDTAARAFYEVDGLAPTEAAAHRAGVVWVAALGTLLVGAVAALLVFLVGGVLVPVFTRAAVSRWWLPADAVTLALQALTGTLFALLRYSREFYVIGHWRMATQATQAAVTVIGLTLMPTLAGAYVAGLAGASVVAALALAVSWRVWTRRAGVPLGRPDWGSAWAAYRRSRGMLFYGNLLGYAKLLQRSADVLLVAYVAGDRETGLYKLARQLVDGGIAVVQDALYQVYFPDFLDLLTRRAATAFRALARRLAVTCAALTAAAVAGEAVLLPTLVPLVFGADFAGAEWPMAIMTLTFFFIAGCHPWIWALYVGAGRLGGYTAMAFAAVAVQYLAMLAGFRWIGPTAAVGMMGMLASYVWLIPATYLLARRRWPRFLPWFSAGSAIARAASPLRLQVTPR